MTVSLDAGINDLSVEMCSYKAYLITILSCRESQGGAHHTGTYDSYNCHNITSFLLFIEKLLQSFSFAHMIVM